MEKKQKVIVYGLGKEFQLQKFQISELFDVVGYSDKYHYNIENYIAPSEIVNHSFEAIYITSDKYYDDIKADIANLVGDKMIFGHKDICQQFENTKLRDQWVEKKLQALTKGLTLLDAGAGEMKYAKYCSHLKYIAQDFGEYKPEACNRGLQVKKWDYSGIDIRCDIVDMPLEDESIDVILCTEVFEHIKNPVKALEEFSRIVKKGGTLILTAPFACLTHMAPYFYNTGFSEYWYLDNLKDLGFEIVEEKKYGNYFAWIGQELYRTSEVAKRYCDLELSNEEINILGNCISIMKRCAAVGEESSELLCFGLMIEAKKK